MTERRLPVSVKGIVFKNNNRCSGPKWLVGTRQS